MILYNVVIDTVSVGLYNTRPEAEQRAAEILAQGQWEPRIKEVTCEDDSDSNKRTD